MGKKLLNILKEKGSLNSNYVGKTRLLDNIKIFGFIPVYSNVSLHIKQVYNDKIVLDYSGGNIQLPVYNNVNILEKDMKYPLRNTYIWCLIGNDDYNKYREGWAMNSNRLRNLPNIEFVDDKPYYKANKGTLSFWKSQETSNDKYAISRGFLVIGSYIQEGEVKYMILDPSEFLCKLEDNSDYNEEEKKIVDQKALEELINLNTKLKKELADAKALATRLEEQLKQAEKQSKPMEIYVLLVVLVMVILILIMNKI